ncbi:hypothetical protein LRS10_12545 [Phenylobacterium sp. J426]|uniref:hypothetical protein n=1 Tax=Phenylobacterium sp. J426 TaxID=2898439 RepID=UPI002151E465|nr:hypothetical protein [Phenylobacterium sp. J426]MCR5874930.1 hypothetical protein [Phenylobacterium sp. J426]
MLRVTGLGLAAVLSLSVSTGALAQASPAQADRTIQQIRNSAGFKAAVATLDAQHERIVNDTITLTEIEAPPSRRRSGPGPIWKC